MKRIHGQEQRRSQSYNFSIKLFCDQEGDPHGCRAQKSIEKVGGPNRRSAGQEEEEGEQAHEKWRALEEEVAFAVVKG
jgi:hypothetical protein